MIEGVGQDGMPLDLCWWKQVIAVLWWCCSDRLDRDTLRGDPLIQPGSLREHGEIGEEQPIARGFIAPGS